MNIALQNEQGSSPNRELEYRRLRDQLESYGQLEYDTTRGIRTTDKWSLNNKYSRFFKRSPWYGAAWLRLKHDYFADVRLRYLVGPALGYKSFEGPALNLRGEIGAIYHPARRKPTPP